MSKEIEKGVDAFLHEIGVTTTANYRGPKRQALGESHTMDEWLFEFKKAATAPIEFEFFTGLGLRSPAPMPRDNGPRPRVNTLMWEQLEAERKPVKPHPANVLHSLVSDARGAEQSFYNWCSDYGYDSDSRRAFRIYEQCQETAARLNKFFGHVVVDQLQTLLEDY